LRSNWFRSSGGGGPSREDGWAFVDKLCNIIFVLLRRYSTEQNLRGIIDLNLDAVIHVEFIHAEFANKRISVDKVSTPREQRFLLAFERD